MESLSPKRIVHILIVDDDPDDHYLLRKAINQVLPHALVESLYDGSEALAYLEKTQVLPDLVILDLNMVKISGQDTMRLIKQNDYISKVPVIIYTTSRNEIEKQKMLEMGATAFFSKANDNAQLVKVVNEIKDNWLS